MALGAGATVVDFMGTAGGALGMCIALYFQLISHRRVHPGIVLAFFVVGMVIFASAIEPLGVSSTVALWLRGIAFTIFIIFEVVAARYIYKTTDGINDGDPPPAGGPQASKDQ